MKFLVDAHLPLHLAYQLQKTGYDTIHTRDLPLENRTPDDAINQISVDEKRIVTTKDADFVNSFMIARRPYKCHFGIMSADVRRTSAFHQNLRSGAPTL